MNLTLGPLALLVVHGKFCLLMNKKVSTWVISMFGLMLLGQPQFLVNDYQKLPNIENHMERALETHNSITHQFREQFQLSLQPDLGNFYQKFFIRPISTVTK